MSSVTERLIVRQTASAQGKWILRRLDRVAFVVLQNHGPSHQIGAVLSDRNGGLGVLVVVGAHTRSTCVVRRVPARPWQVLQGSAAEPGEPQAWLPWDWSKS